MSEVLDWIHGQLIEIVDTPQADGGLAGVIEIQSVQKGDPGWVFSSEYPYLMVQSGAFDSKSETMGLTGWDTITQSYLISVMVDATEFFDPDVTGNETEGPLEDAIIVIWRWFRRLGKRKFDGTVAGIRNVTVGSGDFQPNERGEVYASRAFLLLTVERQLQHQP